ncbi:MAG TPA: hypothetical protein VKY45_14130 [Marinilabiliaceae bacterium]|nr:hypothetical protein [Marinilabiliaceae bacterium]
MIGQRYQNGALLKIDMINVEITSKGNTHWDVIRFWQHRRI